MLLLALLVACVGSKEAPPGDSAPPDTGETGETGDTAEPPVTRSLADAGASFYGGPSYGVGNAVAFAGDDEGDGYDAAVIGVSFVGRTCVVRGPPVPGAHTIEDADVCYTAESELDYAGQAVDGGRDVTGDGVPDLLIGAIGNDELGPEAGKVYLVPGPFTGGPLADAPNWFLGESKSDYAGSAVVLLGDIDGDGAGDLAIGAPANEGGGSGAGKAYIFRGPFEAGGRGLGEADAEVVGEGPTGLLHGAPTNGDGVGSVLAAAGDTDGDGLADLLVGANGNERGGNDAGAAAVFLGPLGDGPRPLTDADVSWVGEVPLQYVGDAVAAAGDVDGDGRADVIIGGDTSNRGSTWLFFGGSAGGAISGAPVRFDGETIGDFAGASAAAAGDLDGDGWADLVLGAYGSDTAGLDAGAAYVLFGPFAPGVTVVTEARRTWLGASPSGEAGRAVAGGGDLDGDGLPDLLVGAAYASTGGDYGGEAYLLTAAP